MKKDITLLDGRIATVTVLKMYANLTSSCISKMDSEEVTFHPLTYTQLSYYKLNHFALNSEFFKEFETVFINSVENEDFRFAKQKGAGQHPIGYVIRVELEGNSYYGVSIKSYKDQWSNQVGLRTAYDRLRRENPKLPTEIFAEGKLARLINLAKS